MLKRIDLVLMIFIFLVGCKERTQSTCEERYVITSPEVAEMFVLLAGTDNIVGLTTECNYPVSLSAIEKIGTFGKVDFERIIELEPTLVFTSGLEQDVLSAELIKLNIPVEMIYPQSISEMLRSIRMIGRKVGLKNRADFVADSLQSEFEKLMQAEIINNSYHDLTYPKVYIEIYGDPLMSVNNTSFVGELVAVAGGDNIFSDLPREYSRIDAERVIESDPDIIILTYPGITADDIRQRKGWEVITAVQSNKIFTADDIDPDLILRASPRCVQGARNLQKAFDE